jgi:hypothetical protein
MPEIKKLKHPNHNYRHETAKEVYQHKIFHLLDENKLYVCRFLNYSDGLKIQQLCTESKRKLAKPYKKYLLKIGHLDAKLRPKLWRHHIKLPETISRIKDLIGFDKIEQNLYLEIL